MQELLQRWGLSEKSSLIYLELLRKGELTANDVAKITSTNRTFTYNVLQSLVDAGLVSYRIERGRRFFCASNPEHFLHRVDEQHRLAEQLVTKIKEFKPQEPVRQKVEVLEGVGGVKEVHDELVNAQTVCVLNATGKIFQHLKYSAYHIIEGLNQKKDTRMIANVSARKTQLNKYANIKFKYLPSEYAGSATTLLFEDVVIFQVLKDKPFLIRIQNKELYDEFASLFELLWDKL